MSEAAIRIGLDFDNTLVTYDAVFLAAARQRGFVGAGFAGRKKAVRDRIRLLPDGELSWRRLQGYVYGRGIVDATMYDGVDAFLRLCRRENVPVVIVSHKTEYGHFDPDRVNLHEAARAWMAAYGFFCKSGFGIQPDDVYFEATRDEKLARIAELGCTHFVDDLQEVLTDPKFPSGVERILFTEEDIPANAAGCNVCPTWRHVEELIFSALR
jgi:hypothetical protein